MAMVRPTRAIARYRWRVAKPSSSSKFTGKGVAARMGEGRRLSPARRLRAKHVPGAGRPGAGLARSVLPEVGQPVGEPPGLGRRVEVPVLGVAGGTLGQRVAVHQVDLDLAHDVAVGQRLRGHVAVPGDLDLQTLADGDVVR